MMYGKKKSSMATKKGTTTKQAMKKKADNRIYGKSTMTKKKK